MAQSDIDRLNGLRTWSDGVQRVFGQAEFPRERSQARRSGRYAQQLVGQIRGLEQGCRELSGQVRRFWRPLTDHSECPAELIASVRPLIDCAAELAGLERHGQRTLSRQAVNARGVSEMLERPIQQLTLRTREMLAGFRWDAPHDLFDRLVADVEKGRDSRTVYTLARAAASDIRHAPVLVKLMSAECRRALTAGSPTSLAPALWALATCLWEEAGVVGRCADAAAELVDCCAETLRRIPGQWKDEGVCTELASEVGMILVALARLRGTPDGEFLNAGNDLTRRLAELVEEAHSSVGVRSTARPPRLRIADLTAEGFSLEVAGVLRGNRIIRVLALEDEDEQ